jgi:hypothetical protein
MCRTLHDRLVSAWGPSTSGTWLDASGHQRARLVNDDSCVLMFERALPAAEWLAKMPLDIVGKSDRALDAFAEKNGIAFEEREADLARWSLPGVGASDTSTEVDVTIEHHKVVNLVIHGSADFDTTVAIRDGLTKALKAHAKRVQDDYGDEYWAWTRNPPAKLTQREGETAFDIFIGKE